MVAFYPQIAVAQALPHEADHEWHVPHNWMRTVAQVKCSHATSFRTKKYYRITVKPPPLVINLVHVQNPPPEKPVSNIYDVSLRFQGKFSAFEDPSLAAKLAVLTAEFMKNVFVPDAIIGLKSLRGRLLTWIHQWFTLVTLTYAYGLKLTGQKYESWKTVDELHQVAPDKPGLSRRAERMYNFLKGTYIRVGTKDVILPNGITWNTDRIRQTSMKIVRDYFTKKIQLGIWAYEFVKTQEETINKIDSAWTAGYTFPVAILMGQILRLGNNQIQTNNRAWYVCEDQKVLLREHSARSLFPRPIGTAAQAIATRLAQNAANDSGEDDQV